MSGRPATSFRAGILLGPRQPRATVRRGDELIYLFEQVDVSECLQRPQLRQHGKLVDQVLETAADLRAVAQAAVGTKVNGLRDVVFHLRRTSVAKGDLKAMQKQIEAVAAVSDVVRHFNEVGLQQLVAVARRAFHCKLPNLDTAGAHSASHARDVAGDEGGSLPNADLVNTDEDNRTTSAATSLAGGLPRQDQVDEVHTVPSQVGTQADGIYQQPHADAVVNADEEGSVAPALVHAGARPQRARSRGAPSSSTQADTLSDGPPRQAREDFDGDAGNAHDGNPGKPPTSQWRPTLRCPSSGAVGRELQHFFVGEVTLQTGTQTSGPDPAPSRCAIGVQASVPRRASRAVQTDVTVLCLPGLSPDGGGATQPTRDAISALGRVQAAVDATAAELAILDGKQPLVGQEVLQLTAAATAARERMASGPFRQLSTADVEARRSLLAELCETQHRGDELRSGLQQLEVQFALNLESGECDVVLADATERLRNLVQNIHDLQLQLSGLESERAQAVLALLEHTHFESQTICSSTSCGLHLRAGPPDDRPLGPADPVGLGHQGARLALRAGALGGAAEAARGPPAGGPHHPEQSATRC